MRASESAVVPSIAGGADPRRASVEGAVDDDDNHIRVICRVRPSSNRDGMGSRPSCLSVTEDGKGIAIKAAGGPKLYTFDHAVGPQGSQEDMFQLVGRPATRSCLQGYNGTIFCYGQTGSGKTFTMFGPNHDNFNSDDDKRGLVPRVLEYLFSHISREERRNGGLVKHLCRCSFYEIFNEKVFDLLDANCSTGGLQVREDMKKGVYVEGLSEEAVESPHHAFQTLAKGYRNRHVGETAMNRESSRSHAVFTLVVESREVNPVDGITRSRCASFNLVDLAGSERQSATGATGERLKEAGSINKSLSALGNVINALVESANGKTRYIPYRDSRLSFLLRDSLGGNAKTFLVAGLSATDENFAETLSTLKFAQRAKMIKNKAVVNEDTSGTVEALQKELKLLRQELLSARAVINASGGTVTVHQGGLQDGGITPTHSLSSAGSGGGATVRRMEELLRDALERSVRMEMARELADQKVRNTQQVVERVEQALLHEKMVRKFKENSILRMRKTTTNTGGGDGSNAGGGGGSPTAADEVEELRQELDLLRKELEQVPRESVKWRLAFEDAQAQLKALADTNGLGMWVDASEQSFTRSLEEELKAVLSDKAELQDRVEKLQEELASRPAVRRLSEGGLQRLKDAEARRAEVEEKLLVARRVAQDAETRLAQKQAEVAEVMQGQSQLTMTVTSLERQLGALREENQLLKKERDDEMLALQERITRLQAQKEEHAVRQDLEGQLAAACRDNCILLQRLRETAIEADKALDKMKAATTEAKAAMEAATQAEEKVSGLQQSVEEMKAQMETETTRHQLAEEALREQVSQALADARTAMAAHEQEMSSLQSQLDEATARSESLRAEKEDLTFQLANLQEDHETQTELLEFTSSRKAEAEEELAQAKAREQEVEALCASHEEAMERLKDRVSSLESELDKVGGDSEKQLREAEKSIRDITEERSALSASLEKVQAELAARAEEWSMADKAAKEQDRRQAQVIADLTDQVSRVRDELNDAEARVQAAKDGMVGLTQEKDNLMQRAEEAEEARAALLDETKIYLDEIETLKAKLTQKEEEHDQEVRAINSKFTALLQKAKEEAAQLHGEVGVLRWEADTLKETVDKVKAERDTYLQMVEETKGAHQDASQASEVLTSKYRDLEALLSTTQEELKDLTKKSKDLEKEMKEAQWRHAEDLAGLRSAFADAQAQAAQAVSTRTALDASEAKVSSLMEAVTGLEREVERAREQKAAADERCEALARQVGEALSLQKDLEAWWEEKARLGGEVARARAMELEANDKYEVVEQQRQKVSKEVETLEKEVEELKAANVRLIGHANSRQKIQLHRKLKEELSAITARAKQLEDENYRLRLQATSKKCIGELRGDVSSVLSNVTNIMKGASENK